MNPGPHSFPSTLIAEMRTTEAAWQTRGLQLLLSLMWAAAVTVAAAENVENLRRFLSDQRFSGVLALVMDLQILLDSARGSSSTGL